ncbi:MAG: DUF87 domain-containing protein [Candidatus Jordarchaeales archaeon]
MGAGSISYVQVALMIVLITFSVVGLRLGKESLGVFHKGAYYKRFRWVLASTLKVTSLPVQVSRGEGGKHENALFYPFQHLTSIWHEVDEVSYELRATGKELTVFFHVFGKGFTLIKATRKLKRALLSVKSSLEARFPGLVLSIPSPEEFREIFKLHQGKPASSKKKTLTVVLPSKERKICVLTVSGGIDTTAYSGLTQIDMLARGLVQLDADASFVVCFKPAKKKFGIIGGDNLARSEKTTGLWSVSCYTLLELDENERDLEFKTLQVKNILSTVFSSSADRLKVKVVSGSTLKRKYSTIAMRRFFGRSFELSSLKLSALTHLPTKGVPGLNLKVKPEFSIPPEKIFQGDGVKVGYVIFEDKKIFPFNLKLEHLRKGVAVLGAIGSGKTRMIMKVAQDVAANYRIPVLIFESKGEFASLIERLPPDMLEKVIILRPGSTYAPLKINLFDPGEMMPEEYARRLFGLLNAVFRSLFREDSELTVQMSRVLSDVLPEVLRNEETRSIEGFLRVLRDYGKREEKNPNIYSTISALEARMNIFLRGMLGEVFNTRSSNVSIEELMRNVTIVDFSYLFSNGGNKEDAQLIMNLLMLHVFQSGLKRVNVNMLSHLVIVDDARFLIPEVFVRRSTSDTTAIEDMITLERGKGQGLILICQDPSVSRIALANCNTRIVFRLSFKSQSEEEFIRMSLNLPEEQREFLLTQPNRSALVKIPEFPHPFPIITNEYNIKEVTPTIIEKHNRTYHPYLFKNSEELNVDHFLEWVASMGSVTLEQAARQIKVKMSDVIELIGKLEKEGYLALKDGKIFIKSS